MSILLKLVPFHSNGLCLYCNHATSNFILNLESHYSGLSNEVSFLYLKGVIRNMSKRAEVCSAGRILFRLSVIAYKGKVLAK